MAVINGPGTRLSRAAALMASSQSSPGVRVIRDWAAAPPVTTVRKTSVQSAVLAQSLPARLPRRTSPIVPDARLRAHCIALKTVKLTMILAGFDRERISSLPW
jgi:hypothetical protein